VVMHLQMPGGGTPNIWHMSRVPIHSVFPTTVLFLRYVLVCHTKFWDTQISCISVLYISDLYLCNNELNLPLTINDCRVYWLWFLTCIDKNLSGIFFVMLAMLWICSIHSYVHVVSGSGGEHAGVVFVRHEWSSLSTPPGSLIWKDSLLINGSVKN